MENRSNRKVVAMVVTLSIVCRIISIVLFLFALALIVAGSGVDPKLVPGSEALGAALFVLSFIVP